MIKLFRMDKTKLSEKWKNLKSFARNNRTGVIASIVLITINFVLLIQNGSWIFEKFTVENYGDQQLYFQLAHSILTRTPQKSIYTLGYPIFFMIFIIKDHMTPDWHQIMAEVISTQAFLIIPFTYFLIFRKLNLKYFLTVLVILIFYFLTSILYAPDPLLKYNFLGLQPLSEPLAILTLILVYFLYFRISQFETITRNRLFLIVLTGILVAYCIMVRTTSAVLIAPLFLHLLLERKFKLILILGVVSAFSFIPQLLWNYWVSHNFLFSSYLWWNTEIASDLNKGIISRIYKVDSEEIFSFIYLKQNLITLFQSYFPLILLLIFARMWRNKFEILFFSFSIVNIIFYLTYFWSAEFRLIDRFLLPNFILAVYILSHKYRKIKSEHSKH